MNEEIDISNRPMSPYQWLIVVICFILNFNDGIDVLIVSFSSPEIIQQWGLSKTEMGYIFSAGLAGMTLGAFLIAPLADKMGRRKIFLISVAMIFLGMFGVGFSDSYVLMLLFRVLTGLGIGGILPTMAATAAEFSNKNYRDFNVGFVQAGWPIGAILTGILSAKYIPIYGWQVTFIVAGCISVIMWLLVFFFMSDSLEFMANHRAENALESINKLLLKMKMISIDRLPDFNQQKEKISVSTLFNNNYGRNTIKIWFGAFFGFMTLYTLMSWVPTIAKDSGMPFKLATYVGIMLNIGAALGSSSIGALGSKFGLRQSILVFMVIAFLIMQFYAFSSPGTYLIFALVLFIGFFVQGGFNGIWPTLSRLYDANIRATGVGYTVGIGRFGAILGPWLFGFLSDYGLETKILFIIFSIPLLLMGACIWSLNSDKL